MIKKVICDIDGVIADCTHRLKYITKPAFSDGSSCNDPDWNAFFDACIDDEPIKPMIDFLWDISLMYNIVYVTVRPERSREKTLAWFVANDVPWMKSTSLLFMRPDGDHRHDCVVKQEILNKYMDRSNIVAVFEDRDRVVDMWRAEGLLCLQPQKGNY